MREYNRRVRVGAYAMSLALSALAPAGGLMAESVKADISYPPPSAVYNQLVTTGDGGVNTVLNRNGGNTVLVPPSNPGGNVGIGTGTPVKKLDVRGEMAATEAIAARTDVLIGTASVFTNFICGEGLACTRTANNSLRIELCDRSYTACNNTTQGQPDNCGHACPMACANPAGCCNVTGGCRYPKDAPCGMLVYGMDPCGYLCSGTIPCQ